MKAQLLLIASLLCVCSLAEEESKGSGSDLRASGSDPLYDYYPPLHPGGHGSSDRGYDSHGHLSKGHDSHGHGHYDDHAVDEKSGYGKHGSHLVSSYGDHGAHGARGAHQDHFGKHSAYVKNSGHGYEKSYSFDKQVHLHDVDAHKSGHHDSHADHGHHGYKDAGHYDQHGHKVYGAHDKHSGYGYGSSGHEKSDYGHQGYDKHIGGAKPAYAVSYGSNHYAPVAPVYVPKAAVPVAAPVYVQKVASPVYAHRPHVPVYTPKVAIPIYGQKPAVPGYYSYQH